MNDNGRKTEKQVFRSIAARQSRVTGGIMKIKRITLIICTISLLGTLVMLFFLPPEIPMHWNAKGEVDSIGSKWNMLWVGFMPLAIYFLLYLIPKIDPKKENFKTHAKTYNITMLSIILFMVLVNWMVVISAMGVDFNTSLWVPLGIGALFIIIGNFMPRIKSNYMFGIRTPWTLANDVVWQKTHKLGGWVFTIMGFMLVVSSFLSTEILVIGIVSLVLISTIVLFMYSYFEFKKVRDETTIEEDE